MYFSALLGHHEVDPIGLYGLADIVVFNLDQKDFPFFLNALIDFLIDVVEYEVLVAAIVIEHLYLAHIYIDAGPFRLNLQRGPVKEPHFVFLVQYKRRFHKFNYSSGKWR